jgi:hypothetical protein
MQYANNCLLLTANGLLVFTVARQRRNGSILFRTCFGILDPETSSGLESSPDFPIIPIIPFLVGIGTPQIMFKELTEKYNWLHLYQKKFNYFF